MRRTETIFAAAAMLVLALGLLARPLVAHRWSVSWGNRGYWLRFETPLFAVAALFALFAFLDSLGHIPFGKTLSQWHPWLSIAGFLLLLADTWGLSVVGLRQPPPPQGSSVVLIAIGMLGGPATFAVAQLWFAFGFLTSLLRMRHHP